MKIVLLIALVLVLASTAAAQTSNTSAGECKLTLAQAPAIRSIRLGMTVDQGLAQFPDAENDPEVRRQLSTGQFGVQETNIVPSQYSSREKFVGVQRVRLTFLDTRLSSFSIWYQGPEWKSVDEFIIRISEALGLPSAEAWEPKSALQNGNKVLKCDGFNVSVFASWSSNSITVSEWGLAEIVHKREEEPKERARRAFRP
jgi:hypothetical protein